jgi:hypothetical protein
VVDGVVVVAVDGEQFADFGEGEGDQRSVGWRWVRFCGWVWLVV